MAQPSPRVLVAGTGFGCRIQVPALRAAGFEVVGLVGSNPERTKERAAANGVAAADGGAVTKVVPSTAAHSVPSSRPRLDDLLEVTG